MITALTAAHAIFEDKENWRQHEGFVEFNAERALIVMNGAAATTMTQEAEYVIGITTATIVSEVSCPIERAYRLAHVIFHLLEVNDEADMARCKHH